MTGGKATLAWCAGSPGHWILWMLEAYMELMGNQASLHGGNPLRLIKHEDINYWTVSF